MTRSTGESDLEKVKGIMTPQLFGILLVALLLGATGQLSMKIGMERFTAHHGDIASLVQLLRAMLQVGVMFGLGCFVLSSMLYLLLLSRLDMSLLYPMVAMNYVFVTILARVVLNEHVSALRVTGLAVIIAGVVVMSMSGQPRPLEVPEAVTDVGTT